MNQQHRIFVGTVGEGIFRSDDDGQTFTRKSHGMFVECDVRALVQHPEDPRVLFAGSNEGVYRSSDSGDTWLRLDSPMNGLVTWALFIDRAKPDTMFAGTRPAKVFRSSDAGRTWMQLDVAIERDCPNLIFNRVTTLVGDPIDADTLWMGIEIGGVRVSRDRGDTWSICSTGLSSLDVHALAVIPLGGSRRRILATTNNDLNISEDDGETWQPQRMRGKFSRPYFRGVLQKRNEANELLVGNGDGPPGSVGTIWRSQDAGRTWLPVELPSDANSTIWGFARHPTNSDRMLAYSVSGELYETMDGGIRWKKLLREFGEIRSLLWVMT
jgi:photosystem II stability/assembly factor-like uncharacterized protein